MKKKILNEEISRIKDMMGKITTESFEDNKQRPEDMIDPELKQRIMNAAEMIQQRSKDVEVVDYDNGEYFVYGYDGLYLNYMYDIDVTSDPSFTPGRMYMDNGDPGYPDEGEPGEAEINIYELEVTNEDSDILYSGPDFTDMSLPKENSIIDKFFEDYEPDNGY